MNEINEEQKERLHQIELEVNNQLDALNETDDESSKAGISQILDQLVKEQSEILSL